GCTHSPVPASLPTSETKGGYLSGVVVHHQLAPGLSATHDAHTSRDTYRSAGWDQATECGLFGVVIVVLLRLVLRLVLRLIIRQVVGAFRELLRDVFRVPRCPSDSNLPDINLFL